MSFEKGKIRDAMDKAYDKVCPPSGFCDCAEEAISSFREEFLKELGLEEDRFELGIKLVKENRLNKAIVQKAIRKAEEKYSIQIKEGEYVQGIEITLLELLQEMGLKDKPDMKDWNNPRCRTKILNTPSKRLEE